MAIGQKDIKLLWGRSGNRCAICKTELTQDKKATTASFTLGEQAHIVGEKKDAARGKSQLSLDERNTYHNLILLCPTHHTEIDKNEEDWSIEKLHLKKSEHELWVTEKLSETVNHVLLAKQTAISSVIDSAVELCGLDSWQNWTSYALAPDPIWKSERIEEIFEFRQKVISAIWSKEFSELKNATITLSILLNSAAQKFAENSDKHDENLYAHKFYKAYGHNTNYDNDLKRYDKWLDECYHLLKEATKAANWFADEVREYINPMFFAEKGKYLISEGPFIDMSFRTTLLEFTEEEKSTFPEILN